jgi:hypothetical protein
VVSKACMHIVCEPPIYFLFGTNVFMFMNTLEVLVLSLSMCAHDVGNPCEVTSANELEGHRN